MKDYNLPPTDFRSSIDARTIAALPTASAVNSVTKLANFNDCVARQTEIRHFRNKWEIVKEAANKEAHEAFNRMAHDAKILVANGESLGDIAKIASRRVHQDDLPMEKVAEAYDMIHKNLVKNGFTVSTEFTKVSSMRINTGAEVLKPVVQFAIAIEKYAAASDICDGINSSLALIDAAVRKISKE